jgi:hypothetical protein
MKLCEFVDYGDAPVIFISGSADISMVDDLVEVILYVRVKLHDGTFENRVAARLRQSHRNFLQDAVAQAQAQAEILKEATQDRRHVASHAH